MRENISLLDSYLITATSWVFHCFRKWPSIFLQGAVPFGGRTKPCTALWLFSDWPYKQSSYNFQYYNHVLTLMIEYHFVCLHVLVCAHPTTAEWTILHSTSPYIIHPLLYLICIVILVYVDICYICYSIASLRFNITLFPYLLTLALITIKVSFIQRRGVTGVGHYCKWKWILWDISCSPARPPYSIPVCSLNQISNVCTCIPCKWSLKTLRLGTHLHYCELQSLHGPKVWYGYNALLKHIFHSSWRDATSNKGKVSRSFSPIRFRFAVSVPRSLASCKTFCKTNEG